MSLLIHSGTDSNGDSDYIITVVVSSVCLLIILTVAATTVNLVVCLKRRREGKNIPNNSDKKNDANPSVRERDIAATTNPVYATTRCSSEDKDITTSTISTTENPAYTPQASASNTLSYDYVRV